MNQRNRWWARLRRAVRPVGRYLPALALSRLAPDPGGSGPASPEGPDVDPGSPGAEPETVPTYDEPPPPALDPLPPPPRISDDDRYDQAVPFGLRVAAGWAWRILALAGLVIALGYGLRYVSEVVVPIAVATLLTALLFPVARQLKKWRLPPALAAGIALLGGLIVVLGALTLIGTQIASNAGKLAEQAAAGTRTLVDWVTTGPLSGIIGVNINSDQIEVWIQDGQNWLRESSGVIASYAADIGSQVGHFLAGIAITLFSTFFFLFQGRKIWTFLLKLTPTPARRRVDEAARLGWNSLVSFVRATVAVAFIDAVGVLAVALILQVPLAPALAALVFFSAFIPLVGALVSGFVAVAVALVALGWVKALIMLGGIILVQQIESHFLQPFLMGRAVAIHPLAIILGIALGIVIGGIVGALIAVPVLAFGKTFVSHLANSGQMVDLRRNIVV